MPAPPHRGTPTPCPRPPAAPPAPVEAAERGVEPPAGPPGKTPPCPARAARRETAPCAGNGASPERGWCPPSTAAWPRRRRTPPESPPGRTSPRRAYLYSVRRPGPWTWFSPALHDLDTRAAIETAAFPSRLFHSLPHGLIEQDGRRRGGVEGVELPPHGYAHLEVAGLGHKAAHAVPLAADDDGGAGPRRRRCRTPTRPPP